MIGIDIDGTITANPRFFAALSRRYRLEGKRVHIVSSRAPAGELETRQELRSYGIAFDLLYLLPESGASAVQCPHATLDWYRKYLWQKVHYALTNELVVFYDDDPAVLQLFTRFAPSITMNPERW